MGRLWSNIRFWLFVVFPAFSALIILFTFQYVQAEYQEKKLLNTNIYSMEELQSFIGDFQATSKVLGDRIKGIKKDINWLILKINRIQDAGKKAPRNLTESVAAKDTMIKILLKEKNRLEKLSSYYANKTFIEKKAPGKKPTKKSSPVITKSIEKISSKTVKDQLDTIKESEIRAAVKKAGLADWVEVTGSGTCLRIETTLPILFSSGSAKVAKEYQSFFKKLASFIKPYDVMVLVNGYTDTLPIKTKQYPSNFELGATRAANIIHELVSQGLKPSIFKIETTGEYRFTAKEPSKQKSFRRRVQVTVIFTG